MAFKNHDELREKIEKALLRSGLRAREIALQTNTPLVIKEDGEIKHIMITEKDIQEFRESSKDTLQ